MNADSQFRAAQANHENSCDCCGRDDRREDEIVAIVERQMDSTADLADVIDSLFESSPTHYALDLARVLTSSDAAFEAEAIRYFRELRMKVRDYLEAEAASLITDNEGPDEAPLPWET